MLKVLGSAGYTPIVNRTNFYIVTDYNGFKELSFDISTGDDAIDKLQEYATLRFGGNQYNITKKNQRSTITTIKAELDFDDWKARIHQSFYMSYATFDSIINAVVPAGWTVNNAGSVTGLHTLDLEGVTDYDILAECIDTYGITYEFDTVDKVINVVKPDTFQSRGLYITDELNLKQLEFKGDGSEICTRLYAYGKKTEEYDEEGNLINTTYVNFADINGGNTFVDNTSYLGRIVSCYWHDDRYEDEQELYDAAVEKLAVLSFPVRSYTCTLIDLSRTNDDYKILDFKLYDKVTLIDRISKVNVQHQIVEYTEYPDNPNNNKVALSTAFKKISGTIDTIKKSISDIDTTIKRSETTVNEIIRDVESNTFKISSMYTKGETDALVGSLIQQSKDSILTEVSETYATGESVSTQLNQTATAFDYQFTQVTTKVDENGNEIAGEVEERKKLIRFDNGDIVLGESTSAITLRIENDRLAFYSNGARISYWEVDANGVPKFYVTDGQFLNSLRLGNFAFMPRSNGNLSFGKVG